MGSIIRFFRSIQAKIIIIYVTLILIAMQLIGVYFNNTLENYFKSELIDTNKKQAILLGQFVERTMVSDPQDPKKLYSDLSEVVSSLFVLSNTEIEIIDERGVVISATATSEQSPLNRKNTTPEVTRTLQGIKVSERIFIDENGKRKMIITQPIGTGIRPIGVVYIVASMQEMYSTMNTINRILLTGTALALGLTALLGIILSSTITKPIKEITKGATAIAEGDFTEPVKVYGQDEISQLGHTFNFMMNSLKDALAMNEEEREKLSSVLTNMNDGVIAADEQGRVIVMNRRAQQILGIAEETNSVMHIAATLGITSEDIKKHAVGKNQVMMIEIDNEEEERITVRVTFTPILRRGDETGMIAVLQDVTVQEKLEQGRKDFVANVSHELRTPLTTIKSYLEALTDGAMEDPALAQRFLGVTRNETERMIRLVTDLLHLSRLDSKQAVIVKEHVEVSEMLDELVDRFSFQLRQRHIRITSKVDPKLGAVEIDRDKIDQVLDNLVSNSIKYTGDEGIITASAYIIDEHWMGISITDTGMGIPKKDLSRIFERFYRVDKARSRNMGGTGLGLSIAREIVRAHGGAISLESELNQGTKVTFTLPLESKAGEVN
ncbi:cell wall metabolism sensor histidine kinase WalK [Paenibacillus sp. N1-5-1-14]|uniref:cell wall metabolism sensor histidine kinase WalK n=1 Tax=Paenibacillus radicibacter TaxID=2972488 RepID=UPI002159B5B4|nr:cell wall metabolism sensor histidine kinase WalK [Paenibacillus radicibacter]MCR8642978.1 cell wall metabolism sensor histidine kinase WalK [Paenibacillus radicibacter]